MIASIWLSIVGAAIMAVVLLAGAEPIARHFFHDPSPNVVAGIRLLPLAVSLTIAVVTLQGLLNVSRVIGRLALTQVAGAATLTALAWPLAQWAGGGSQPAFVVIVAVPALVQFGLVVIVARRLGWGGDVWAALRSLPGRADVAYFTRYFVSGIGATLSATIVFFTLRSLLVERTGQEGHGLFQAAWALSLQAIGLLVSAFGTYYLPVMSAAVGDDVLRRKTMNDAVELIILVTLIPIVVGLAFQPLILGLLYSDAFTPAVDMLRWLLIANYARTIQALIFNTLMAVGRPRALLVLEIAWNLLFFAVGLLAMSDVAPTWMRGAEGICVAFVVAQFASVLGGGAYIAGWCGIGIDRRTLLVWAAGLAVVVAAAVATWGHRSTDWPVSLLVVGLGVLAPLAIAGPRRENQVRQRIATWRSGRRET